MKYDLAPLQEALTVQTKLIEPEVFTQHVQDADGDLAFLVSTLIKEKLVKPQIIDDFLLRAYGFKYIGLDRVLIKPSFLQKIPKEFSLEHEVLIFGENGYKMQLAMINPSDLYAIEYVKQRTGQEVEIYITDIASFQTVVKGFRSDIQELFSDVLHEGSAQDVKNLAEGVPVTKAVNSIIEYAVSEGASDIHIEPTENEVIVRFRIDGLLHDVLVLLKTIHPVLTARIKIMADLKIDEHRRPQDGRIKLMVNELPISLRVSVLPTYQGEKIVIRVLDESVRSLTLKDLGFFDNELKAISEAIQRPDGMILVTGPTGSGKTTTLYTIMKILNKPDVNINTVEDPIEYGMPRINQTQVNSEIGFTFANGLRSLLRQDPDIIMVGEIRDEETANMAIHSSMTGHLVLSTLHTNDAPGAIPRFIDMGIEPFLLASTLNLAVAQRLVRKLCNECKLESKLDATSKKVITEQLLELGLPKAEIEKWSKIKFYNAVGCQQCGQTGYRGRLAILEVLKVTDKVRDLIVSKVPGQKYREEMIAQGHMPMFINGLIQADRGVTTLTEIMRVAKE